MSIYELCLMVIVMIVGCEVCKKRNLNLAKSKGSHFAKEWTKKRNLCYWTIYKETTSKFKENNFIA